MSTFDDIKFRFSKLCIKYGISIPEIRPSVPDDVCDWTSKEEVRFNLKAAGDIDPDWYAAHVFGHYLCDLHEYANCINDDDLCEQVANTIARMITGMPE